MIHVFATTDQLQRCVLGILGINLNVTQFLKKYLASIDDYVEKGYARKLTPEETKVRSNTTWYLPHHPVLNPRKPGKVRAVFDAASTFAGTSLNEELLQGPDLINNLVGVLVRFRQDPFALITDIESMFHQVRVIPEDTDALQFLWTDGDLQKPEEYKMLVHIFGAKSSPCCANRALQETANDNEAKYSKLVADVVQRNFYVDNLLKSTTTVEQAIDLSLKLISLLQEELYFQGCIANATTHGHFISQNYFLHIIPYDDRSFYRTTWGDRGQTTPASRTSFSAPCFFLPTWLCCYIKKTKMPSMTFMTDDKV